MDHIACGFMDAARKEFQLSIPQDMSLIGFDDIRLASYQSYALTTIKQCPKLVSKAVVDNLVKRLDEPSSSPMYQVVPVTLIRRDTLAS
jgi:DNA-binding LacI/PurR family transcriptional regulator